MITELYLNENFKNNIEYPFEFLTQAIYENELNMERIEKAMMLEEYYYLLENGYELSSVQEGAIDSIKEFFRKIKEAIVSLWNKIKEFFKSIFSNSISDSKLNKEAAKMAKESDIIGKKFQINWYEYNKSAIEITDLSSFLLGAITGQLQRLLDKCKQIDSILNKVTDQSLNNPDEISEFKYDFTYSLIKNEQARKIGVKSSDYKIDELLENECRKKSNIATITQKDISDLENSDSVYRQIKTCFDKTDTMCKNAINNINDLIKIYNEKTSDDSDNFQNKLIKFKSQLIMAAAKSLPKAVQDAADINKVTVKMLNQKFAQIRVIIGTYC